MRPVESNQPLAPEDNFTKFPPKSSLQQNTATSTYQVSTIGDKKNERVKVKHARAIWLEYFIAKATMASRNCRNFHSSTRRFIVFKLHTNQSKISTCSSATEASGMRTSRVRWPPVLPQPINKIDKQRHCWDIANMRGTEWKLPLTLQALSVSQ